MVKVGLGALVFALSLGIAKQRGDFKKQTTAMQEKLDEVEARNQDVGNQLRQLSATAPKEIAPQLQALSSVLLSGEHAVQTAAVPPTAETPATPGTAHAISTCP